MTLHRWFRGWFARSLRFQGKIRWRFGGKIVYCKPKLQVLEDRIQPATVNWINAAGGDWDTPGNWSGDSVPGAGDDAVISQSGITITHSTGASDAVNSIQSSATLSLSNGTLSIASASSLSALTESGGTLTGAGTVTVSGELSWTNGTMAGTGTTDVASSGMLVISGSSTVFLDRALENDGTGSWTGNVYIEMDGGTFTNDGSLTADSTQKLRAIGSYGDNVFVNNGTFTQEGSDEVDVTNGFGSDLVFNNAGTVNVNSGVLSLDSGGTASGENSFTVASGATLGFDDAYSLDSNSTVGGAGNAEFSDGSVSFSSGAAYNVSGTTIDGGTVSFAAGSSVAALGSLTIGSGSIDFSSGVAVSTDKLTESGGTLTGSDTVTVSGALSWTDGTMSGSGATVAEGGLTLGVQEMDYFATLLLNGRSLVNADSATLSGGVVYYAPETLYFYKPNTISLNNGATVVNESGATWSILDDSGFSSDSTATSFINQGSLIKSRGTGTSTIGVALNNTGTVNVNTGDLSLGGRGSCSGSFSVSAGTTLGFDADQTTTTLNSGTTISGAGTIEFGGSGTTNFATGTTYNVTGGITVDGGIANFNSGTNVQAIGSVLTISSGTINFSTGAAISTDKLTETGGTLTGSDTVTVSGALSWTDGAMSGSGATVAEGGLTLGVQEMDYFATLLLNGRSLVNADSATLSGGVVYYAPETLYFYKPNTISLNNGATVVNESGATWSILDDSGFSSDSTATSFINQGSLIKSRGTGTSTIGVALNNTGSLKVQSGTLALPSPTVDVNDSGLLASAFGTTIAIGGNLRGSTTNAEQFDPQGTTLLDGSGGSSSPQLLEAMSNDLGPVASAFTNNFDYSNLTLGSNTYVRLVDNAHNSSGSGADALYVNALVVPSGSTLDLNGLHVYARDSQIKGQILNGSISYYSSNGGLITFNTPTLGSLQTSTQVDDWTFFGRAGHAVSVVVTTGSGGNPAPLVPSLNYAQVTLLDPSGNVLGTASNTTAGANDSLLGIALPADGVYHIHVQVSAANNAVTGFYNITAADATVHQADLPINETVTGQLADQYSVDHWTFSVAAGQQISFNLLNASSSSIQFDLTGRGGFTAFSGTTTSSGLIDLPSAGTYSLTVHSVGLAGGAYAFQVQQTSVTALALGTPYQGSLTASGQAQLFTFTVGGGATLIDLTDPNPEDHNEVYVKVGSAPTRDSYDYSFNGVPAANQRVVFTANPGTYYVLVYNNLVTASGNYTLLAQSGSFIVTGITPGHVGNGYPTTLEVTGVFPVGYQPGLAAAGSTGSNGGGSSGYFYLNTFPTVQFLAADGTVVPNATLYLQLPNLGLDWNSGRNTDGTMTVSTNLPANLLPAGTYSVLVTDTSGYSQTLANALSVVQGGVGVLQTNLIVPNPIGYHIASTIYVQYSNVGTAPMPAPLLVLTALQNNVAGALMTLDASKQVSGFWTSATPDGYSQSVQFLASGAVPGVLQPGESVTVPVYYAGWLTGQWDFSRPPINFSLGALDTFNTATVPWSTLQNSLRPTSISPTAWDALYPDLTAQLGTTWGGYVQRLDADAQYLASLGENVTDISQLVDFEVQQANGFSPLSSLASSTDAQVAVPGLPLGFDRTFAPAIITRNTFGPFGWGWSDSWQTSITVDPDGSVNVLGPDGSLRRFQPDLRGGYFAQPGDHGTLTALAGGGYTLTELNGQVTAYNANGSLNYIQDADGNRITAGYTGGLLTSLTDSSGQSLTLTYNAAGLIATITDSAGRVTTYNYDPTNQYLTSVVDFDGQTTSYTYDTGTDPTTAHALLSVTYPDGSHDYFSYDARGQLADAHRDGNAEDTTFSYSEGQVTLTDALQNATTYSFDNRGLLLQVQDPLNNSVHFAYDNNLNLVQTTDAAGQNYTNTYDAQGNLLSSTDPLGNTVHYTYSTTDDRLASVTDGDGNTTTYGYDGKGDLTSTTYADGTVASVAYDPVGDVLSTANHRGQATHYTYDAAGNILIESFADGSQVTFTYDGHENLTSATDASGTTTLTYDANDRLKKITYPSGRYLQYTYDTAGRRTQMVDQTGFTVNYGYDTLGRLATLTDGAGNPIATYTYDVVGRLSRTDNGNGTYTTYAYDAAGDLLHLVNYAPGGAVNSHFDYTYDSLGRRITEATVDGAWTYTYDAIGELTHAVFASTNPAVANQDLAYAYDAAGNRTQTIINGVTTAYTTNNLNEYTQVGGTAYRYDADGNLVSATDATGTTTYAYNSQNQLTGVTGPSGSWSYQYDAFGNRVATTQAGVTTQYLVDPAGLGDVVSTYNSGGLINHYTYGQGLTSQTDALGISSYYEFDNSGATVGLTSATGQYSSDIRYLPFGVVLASTTGSITPFTFNGQLGVTSDGSGLDAMRNRDYASSLGRFTSQDPLNVAGGGPNLYTFASNSPSNLVDPTGLESESYGSKFVQGLANQAQSYENIMDAYDRDSGLAAPGKSSGPNINQAFDQLNQANQQIAQNAPGFAAELIQNYAAFFLKIPEQIGIGLATFGRDLYDFGNYLNNLSNSTRPSNAPQSGHTTSPTPPSTTTTTSTTQSVTSHDPNDKFGPAGYGPQGFVAPDTLFPYRIDFENDPTATAPAQRVDVTDQLDANLDWNTFQLTGFGFGDNNIAIPPNSQYFHTTLPMTYNGQTFQVVIDLNLDALTGLLHVSFQSVDPKTSLPPDVLTGFLPPENGTGRGMGYITYAVKPKAGLPTGTQIRNVAQVQFDLSTIIATDQVNDNDPSLGVDPTKQDLNTIDAGPPTSSVTTLPPLSPSQITVSWSGHDDPGGSGIASYTIWVSVDGSTFTPWLTTSATQTSATYTGTDSHTYAFYSVATDNVGNVQPTPTTAQATTLVDAVPPTSTVTALPSFSTGTFTLNWSGSDNTGGSGLASYDVYVSEDGGAFTPLLADTTATSTTFTGVDGHSYGFFSVATDVAGNRQATPPAAQAITQVDTSPPTSNVLALPHYSPLSFTLNWSGSDSGSGIASFTIYESEDGSAFTPLLSDTTTTSLAFTGVDGHTYGFYSAAVDNVGNVQTTLASAQTSTLIRTATQLVVTTPPPGSVTAGSGFGLTIKAEDATDNVDLGFTSSVQLELAANPGGSTLGGTLTLNAVNGVASFTGLTLNKADAGYELRAISDGLPLVFTNTVTVTPAAATQLVVTGQPPAYVTTAAAIDFVVAAEDPFGNVDPTFNGKVSVALANNPTTGSKLGGTLSASAINGLAVLAGPTLNKLGSGYTLKVTNPSLSSATTNGINVVTSSYKGRVTHGSGQSATVGTTFAAALQVAVTGLTGKAATNVPVTFTITSAGAGASFQVAGSPTTVTVNTNSAGVAAAPPLSANTTSGSYSVSVALQGVVVPVVFSETNKAGAPATIADAAGANQSATVGTKFAHPLQVIVKDPYGNLVPNAAVVFTAPTTGARGTFSVAGSPTHVTVKTNAAGLATAPAFVAGKVAGSYTVTASAGSLQTDFGETNAAGAPAVITIKGGSGQSTKVSISFANPLQVSVTDLYGNVLANLPVTFTAPGTGASGTFAATGSPAQVVVNTNAAGVATAPVLTANTKVGTFTVTASVAGVKKGVSFRETNTD